MRTFTLAAAFSLVLLIAGCDSVSDSIQSGFSANAPHSRTFHGQAQDLSAAVVIALKRLDFTVTSPNGGGDHIEASGRIQHSEGISDAHQVIADVKLVGAGPGETEVQILLTEQSDDGTTGGRSEKSVKNGGVYGTFFDTIKQVLSETYSPTAAPTGTPLPHTSRD